MASKALKGLTVKIGGDTSELSKSLDSIDKKSRSLSGELGQINKLLKLDPKNTELLAQKQKVLADAIKNTESKLDTLREAEKQVQAQFERGEVSEEQYRALQREIIETENKLNGYRKAVDDTKDAVKAAAKGSKSLAESLDKTEKEAEEAEQELDNVAAGAVDLAKNGLATAVAAATALVGSLVAMAEASREYRTEMAKLDTAFTEAGHSSLTATKTYKELQSVVGETEQAVEAANHLAKLASTEEDLSKWTEILTGVYGTFGASLSIESLAEAANETAKVGTVTGSVADALNWAAQEGETFGVTLKANTEANEEWNKAVTEAASAEDYFNLALQECSSEQERQQLITETLTKLYGSAAAKYKATNKEVIRANQATEEWNAAMAELGGEMEPVITDVKEMGLALVDDVKEPLKDLVDFVRTKVLPAITQAGDWVKKNRKLVISFVTGLAAATVAYKVAVVASTLASKGWTVATLAQAAAQKVLDAVMAASPWGLVATAIIGVTAAVVAYTIAVSNSYEPTEVLTEKEKEMATAADEAAQAFHDQKKATDEALKGITAQYDYVEKLTDELDGLADASGRVQENDQARVQFILNELNSALDTEYTMVDGVIQKYNELKTSVDAVIQSKLANALLDASKDDYVAAVQGEAEALNNVNLKYEEYQAALADHEEVTAKAQEWVDRANEAHSKGAIKLSEYYALRAALMTGDLKAVNENLEAKETAYNGAIETYATHYNTIRDYKEAQTAILEGNTQTAIDLLSRKGGAYVTYSDKVDEETQNVLDTLYKEAVDAGLEAERMRTNFEKGVDGLGEEMVVDAEKNYKEAMDKFSNAYADAESVGEDLAEGMTTGAENKRSSLLAKARSLVSGFLEAARNAADSHSPSRKAIKVFEDIGDGAVIGVDNKTDEVERAATDQVAAVIDAYRTPENIGQRAFRNIADQQAERYAAEQNAAVSSTAPMLERILDALEKGQTLTIDGDTLVGATAARMDTALGGRRVLSARGAI